MELTARETLGSGHDDVGCEHLLLGLLAASAWHLGLYPRPTRSA